MTTTQPSLLNTDVQSIVLSLDNQGIEKWSEEKKKDFVRIFRQRASCTKYIYYKMAEILIERARAKKLISNKHVHAFAEKHPSRLVETYDPSYNAAGDEVPHWKSVKSATVGGRTPKELDEIATQRAEDILKELPSVRKALSIIQPGVVAKMDRRDVVLAEGQELVKDLEKLSRPIRLKMMPDDMTVKEFLAKAHDQERARDEIIRKLEHLGAEGLELENFINTSLFEGIPEICDAVLKVAKDHYNRGVFFGQATRRVEEKVLVGDSKEATDILKRFEEDELDVPGTIKKDFVEALGRLQLLGKSKPAKKSKEKELSK